jgi:hypothetical protein
VSAAGQDDETVSAHHRHEGLIVEDQRVGLPPAMPVGLVPRKAALELRGPVDLAGHQQRALEQEGGLALLDDLEACALQCTLARRGKLDRVTSGEREAAASPELRVDQDGHVRAPELADQAVHARDVIPMTVAEDDDVDVSGGQLEPAHVLHEAVGGPTGVEEHAGLTVALGDCHQRGEPVLGTQRVVGVTACEEGCRHPWRGPHRGPLCRTFVGEQRVGHVVHQRGHRDRVDGFECDRRHDPPP